MDNAIEARGLAKTCRGDVRALEGVSLAAAKGPVFGLRGPNGAGKYAQARSTIESILTPNAHDLSSRCENMAKALDSASHTMNEAL